MSQTTRTLILVRHAKTEQVSGKIDHDRELLPRGVADARAGGAWLVEHDLVPDLVLCSTATRARQTWERLAEGGDLQDVEVWAEPGLYVAHPEEILAVIREAPEDRRTVVAVGHAPGMGHLAAGLADAATSDAAALESLEDGMPTAVGAVLEVDGDWADLGPETARLVGVHRWRGAARTAS